MAAPLGDPPRLTGGAGMNFPGADGSELIRRSVPALTSQANREPFGRYTGPSGYCKPLATSVNSDSLREDISISLVHYVGVAICNSRRTCRGIPGTGRCS